MKITKRQLKRIIREERARLIREFNDAGDISGARRVDYKDDEDLEINPHGTGNREAEPDNHGIGHT